MARPPPAAGDVRGRRCRFAGRQRREEFAIDLELSQALLDQALQEIPPITRARALAQIPRESSMQGYRVRAEAHRATGATSFDARVRTPSRRDEELIVAAMPDHMNEIEPRTGDRAASSWWVLLNEGDATPTIIAHSANGPPDRLSASRLTCSSTAWAGAPITRDAMPDTPVEDLIRAARTASSEVVSFQVPPFVVSVRRLTQYLSPHTESGSVAYLAACRRRRFCRCRGCYGQLVFLSETSAVGNCRRRATLRTSRRRVTGYTQHVVFRRGSHGERSQDSATSRGGGAVRGRT